MNILDRTWGLLLLALLIGAGLRGIGLGTLSDTVVYDEAAYALDALSLLDVPRIQLFFESNFGREGLWMYLLAPGLAIFGPGPFALRVTAFFVSVLTVAAVARLGWALFGRQGAGWVALAFAVLYWPVHLGHIGFRALLLPLIGALAFAALLRASQTGRGWLLAGILTGLLLYTYTAAQVWFGFALLTLLLMILGGMRGAWLSLVTALAVAAPMIYLLLTGGFERGAAVAIDRMTQLYANIGLWLNAFLTSGDTYPVHNLPGRPIWDVPLAILSVIGLVWLGRLTRQVWYGVMMVLLLILSLLPSLFSVDAPHFLRAIGMVVPLAVLAGAGALLIERRLGRWRITLWGLVAVFLLIGGHTLLDLASGLRAFRSFAQPERQTLAAVAALSPDDVSLIYAMPYTHPHPIPQFAARAAGITDVRAFDPGYCRVYANTQRARYITSQDASGFHQAALADRASVETVAPLTLNVRADVDLFAAWTTAPRFGETSVQLLTPLPTAMRPGASVDIDVAVRGGAPVPLNLFVQMLDTTGVVAQVVSNDDQHLCEPYPTIYWQPDEVIVQTFTVRVPDDTPAETYPVVLGIYDPATGQRLLLVDGGDTIRLGFVRVLVD